MIQDSNLNERSIHKTEHGPIPGIEPGAMFWSRRQCATAGVHAVVFAGIHGSRERGAYSICMSGLYEDDKDDGEFFVYSGTGGKENALSPNAKVDGNQGFYHHSNAALRRSAETRLPVRVVRGWRLDSKWAPLDGYRYDGLYTVEKAYLAEGLSGHQVCKFEFRRLPDQPPLPVKPVW